MDGQAMDFLYRFSIAPEHNINIPIEVESTHYCCFKPSFIESLVQHVLSG
jgi:hypothetical protein